MGALVFGGKLAALPDEHETFRLRIRRGNAAVGLVETFFRLRRVGMFARRKLAVEIRVQPAPLRAADDVGDVLSRNSARPVHTGDENHDRIHSRMGYLRQMRVRKNVQSPPGMGHARGKKRSARSGPLLQKRCAAQIHHVFKMIERLRRRTRIRSGYPHPLSGVDPAGALRHAFVRRDRKRRLGAAAADGRLHRHGYFEIVDEILRRGRQHLVRIPGESDDGPIRKHKLVR